MYMFIVLTVTEPCLRTLIPGTEENLPFSGYGAYVPVECSEGYTTALSQLQYSVSCDAFGVWRDMQNCLRKGFYRYCFPGFS